MVAPEGLGSTYTDGSEEESEETEPDRPVAMTTYESDPTLTAQEKRAEQAKAEEAESSDEE